MASELTAEDLEFLAWEMSRDRSPRVVETREIVVRLGEPSEADLLTLRDWVWRTGVYQYVRPSEWQALGVAPPGRSRFSSEECAELERDLAQPRSRRRSWFYWFQR